MILYMNCRKNLPICERLACWFARNLTQNKKAFSYCGIMKCFSAFRSAIARTARINNKRSYIHNINITNWYKNANNKYIIKLNDLYGMKCFRIDLISRTILEVLELITVGEASQIKRMRRYKILRFNVLYVTVVYALVVSERV